MEKNIFNKILILNIITILLLNWCFSYIVFADSTEETLENIEIQENNVGQPTYIKLKKDAVEQLRAQLEEKYNYKGSVEELAEICEIDLTDGTAGTEISSEGKQIKIDDDTTIILGFNINIETGADPSLSSSPLNPEGAYTKIVIGDINVVKNTGEDNNDEKNEEDSNSNSINFGSELIINGKRVSGNTDWDVGGVLLKPIFFLVNCVFDTILAIVQKVMYSDVSDLNLLSAYVKTNYIDKLRVMDSRNIDPMFQLSMNQINYVLFTDQRIGSSEYPHIHYSPEEIFSGQISLLNIDFISGEGQAEGLGVIRKTIATWYNVLRLIATVGFLLVLIYIGIKIIITSSSSDKAKYKEWLIDWIIGIAMLYSMHFIMAFIISAINQLNSHLITVMPIIRVAAGNGFESFSTNLIGLVRFCTQYDTIMLKIGYEIMYIMLVIYTLKFTFVYIRRVIYMAFLTIIAPIVAFTYPIDKLLDGKAEGFSMWLKEFFFNALLQPMHYLLYYVMVSSSIEIAIKNPLYAVAVLAFMTEAERLIRKIFGFEKAREGTVGGLGTALSGLALVQGAKKLTGMRKSNQQSSTMNFPGAINKDYKNQDYLPQGEETNFNNDDASSNNSLGAMAEGNDNNISTNHQNASNNQNNTNTLNNQDNSNNDFIPMGRPRLLGKINPNKKEETMLDKIQPKLEPIHKLAERAKNTQVGQTATALANSKIGRGTRAIGKRALRPIWDFDRSGKYNFKRLVRNVAVGSVGAGIGLTVAAVQAGISLADGKYNPREAIGSFAAGYALAGRQVGNIVDTFQEGYQEVLIKEEKMKSYQEEFKNREDVIQFCKENYGDKWKEYRERIIDNYVTRGFIDLNEIKQGIKYSDRISKEVNNSRTYLNENQKNKTLKLEKDKQDVIAMYIMSQKKKRQKIHASSISYNKKKEERYLKSVTQGMKPEDAKKTIKQERTISASIRFFDQKISEIE